MFQVEPPIPWFAWTIISLLGVYLFEQWLHWKQRQQLRRPLPTKLEDDIPLHEYLDKQRYALRKSKFRFIQDTVNVIHSLSRLWRTSSFWSLAQYVSPVKSNIVISIIFLVLFSLEKTIVNLPFSLYRRLYLRNPFKTYPQSIPVYLSVKIKQIIYRGLLILPLMTLILSVEPWLRPSFALYAWIAIIIESMIIWTLYPTYIAPFFHQFIQIPPGELRNRLLALCSRMGFPMDCIVTDQSSPVIDVRYVGIFSPKYLVISAPALKVLDSQTITTLVAHEIARWKGSHMIIWYTMRILYNGFWLYILKCHLYDAELYIHFNVPNQLIIGYVILSILYTPIQSLYLMIEHVVMRGLECQADQVPAVANLDWAEDRSRLATLKLGSSPSYQVPAVARDGLNMKSALIKFSAIKQSTMNRDPDYSIYFKERPTLLERLDNLDRHS